MPSQKAGQKNFQGGLCPKVQPLANETGLYV